VRPDGSRHTILKLTPGDVFGLVQPADDGTFVPHVVADTDCEVVGIDLSIAGPLIAGNPGLVEALNQIVSTRTRRIERSVSDRMDIPELDASPSEMVAPDKEADTP
jgi:CRP-like cAMP-binding protein